MRIIEAVYSPICEATGAMLGMLEEWLGGTDVLVRAYPFHLCPQRLKDKFRLDRWFSSSLGLSKIWF